MSKEIRTIRAEMLQIDLDPGSFRKAVLSLLSLANPLHAEIDGHLKEILKMKSKLKGVS